ncbi:MAG: GC-type dockerin domain-anchored protein [Planctomycetota bacterium]
MKRNCLLGGVLVAAWGVPHVVASTGSGIEIPFVTVGDPGNVALTPETSAWPDRPRQGWGYGSVDYEFQIMQRPVTIREWQGFLDVLSPHWPYWLTSPLNPSFSGAGDWEDRGVGEWTALVPLDAAAAFANWLHNGRVNEPWAFFTGVYDFDEMVRTDVGSIRDLPAVRPDDARYWLPSLDEVFKAGFYEGRSAEYPEGRWYRYSNSSDSELVPGPPGEGEMPDVFDTVIYVMNDVGQYPGTQSPWGLTDWALSGCGWSDTPGPSGRVYLFGSDFIELAWEPRIVADYEMFLCGNVPTSTGASSVRIARSPEAAIDLAIPLGVVDLADVTAFIDAFLSGGAEADIVPPFGVLDLSDLDAFITIYLR